MDARHGGPARCLCQDIERQHPSDHSQFTFSSRLSVCQARLVMCRDVTSSLPGPLDPSIDTNKDIDMKTCQICL